MSHKHMSDFTVMFLKFAFNSVELFAFGGISKKTYIFMRFHSIYEWLPTIFGSARFIG